MIFANKSCIWVDSPIFGHHISVIRMVAVSESTSLLPGITAVDDFQQVFSATE
jgi:hypothetical protein